MEEEQNPYDIVDFSVKKSKVGPMLVIDGIPGASEPLKIYLRTFVHGYSTASELDVETDCDGQNGCWWIILGDGDVVAEIQPELIENLG